MKQKQSSNTLKAPFLICTQIFQKATLANKSCSLSSEPTSLSLPKNHFKDYYRTKCQLLVKGKNAIQQIQKVLTNKQQKSQEIQNKKDFKKQGSWFDQVSVKKQGKAKPQKMVDSLMVSNHLKLLNLQNSNVFMSPKQHRRFYKILRKNNSNKKSKTQYISDELMTQEQIEKERQLSFLQRKGYFYRTSQIQQLDSNHNREISLQLFEPKLKHKTRPSSGDPMRKYKMSSLMIITKKKSICGNEININKLSNHIKSFVSNEKNQEQNKSPTARKQEKDNTLQNLKKKMILKTQPNICRNKGIQISIRTSQGINPWSDEEGKQKNIIEDQIHVRL